MAKQQKKQTTQPLQFAIPRSMIDIRI